jgi:hypothetical protein
MDDFAGHLYPQKDCFIKTTRKDIRFLFTRGRR